MEKRTKKQKNREPTHMTMKHPPPTRRAFALSSIGLAAALLLSRAQAQGDKPKEENGNLVITG